MLQNKAREAIHSYVYGWKENNPEKILKYLSKDCKIIESHGPTYTGIEKVKKWIKDWFSNGSRVNHWEITSFYFANNAAFFEWEFECEVDNQIDSISGSSIVLFEQNKISYMREYRTTNPLHEWQA